MSIEDLSKLPATIFSPAKMVYIGYILLASLGKIDTSIFEFIWASVIFILIEVFHNDYLRIRLNKMASR